MSRSRVTNLLEEIFQGLSDNPTPHGHYVTYPCFSPKSSALTNGSTLFPKVALAGKSHYCHREESLAARLKTHGHFSGVHAGQLTTDGQVRAA